MPTDHPAIRISDAEREQVSAALGQHLATGRLTMTEFEDRLDVIYAARTRGEVSVVLTDLPITEPPPPLPSVPDAPAACAPAWTSWALTGAICLLIWVTTSLTQGQPLNFWPAWVIGPWGIVLIARAAQIRHARGVRPGRFLIHPSLR